MSVTQRDEVEYKYFKRKKHILKEAADTEVDTTIFNRIPLRIRLMVGGDGDNRQSLYSSGKNVHFSIPKKETT